MLSFLQLFETEKNPLERELTKKITQGLLHFDMDRDLLIDLLARLHPTSVLSIIDSLDIKPRRHILYRIAKLPWSVDRKAAKKHILATVAKRKEEKGYGAGDGVFNGVLRTPIDRVARRVTSSAF